MVVVGKLSSVKEVDPIILVVHREHVKVCLKPLIVCLTLGLQMVGGGEMLVNAKGAVKVAHIWGGELGATISVVMQREAMKRPYMLDMELGKLFGSAGGLAGDEMGHFHEVVGNNINGIKAMGWGKLHNKVRLGPKPGALRVQQQV